MHTEPRGYNDRDEGFIVLVWYSVDWEQGQRPFLSGLVQPIHCGKQPQRCFVVGENQNI